MSGLTKLAHDGEKCEEVRDVFGDLIRVGPVTRDGVVLAMRVEIRDADGTKAELLFDAYEAAKVRDAMSKTIKLMSGAAS